MTDCENCRKLEKMYAEDVSKLIEDIRRLEAENEKLKLGSKKAEPAKQHQIRHV